MKKTRNLLLVLVGLIMCAGCSGFRINIDSQKFVEQMGIRGVGYAVGIEVLKTPEKIDMALEYLNTLGGARDVPALKVILDLGFDYLKKETGNLYLNSVIDDLRASIEFEVAEDGLKVNIDDLNVKVSAFRDGLVIARTELM